MVMHRFRKPAGESPYRFKSYTLRLRKMNFMYENFAKPTIKFCEENISSYIAQPANTWSSLIYIFIGTFLFFLSKSSKNLLLKFLGLIVILIGLFSSFYHASYTFWGQFLDLGSMFLFSSYLLVFNLRRLHIQFFTTKKLFFVFFALVSISLSMVYFIKTINDFNIGIPIFIFQLLAVLILEWRLYRQGTNNYKIHNLLIALVILIISFIFWILDFSRIWCGQETFHLINGHALWHILNSFSFIFIYFFYRQFD